MSFLPKAYASRFLIWSYCIGRGLQCTLNTHDDSRHPSLAPALKCSALGFLTASNNADIRQPLKGSPLSLSPLMVKRGWACPRAESSVVQTLQRWSPALTETHLPVAAAASNSSSFWSWGSSRPDLHFLVSLWLERPCTPPAPGPGGPPALTLGLSQLQLLAWPVSMFTSPSQPATGLGMSIWRIRGSPRTLCGGWTRRHPSSTGAAWQSGHPKGQPASEGSSQPQAPPFPSEGCCEEPRGPSSSRSAWYTAGAH